MPAVKINAPLNALTDDDLDQLGRIADGSLARNAGRLTDWLRDVVQAERAACSNGEAEAAPRFAWLDFNRWSDVNIANALPGAWCLVQAFIPESTEDLLHSGALAFLSEVNLTLVSVGKQRLLARSRAARTSAE